MNGTRAGPWKLALLRAPTLPAPLARRRISVDALVLCAATRHTGDRIAHACGGAVPPVRLTRLTQPTSSYLTAKLLCRTLPVGPYGVCKYVCALSASLYSVVTFNAMLPSRKGSSS